MDLTEWGLSTLTKTGESLRSSSEWVDLHWILAKSTDGSVVSRSLSPVEGRFREETSLGGVRGPCEPSNGE